MSQNEWIERGRRRGRDGQRGGGGQRQLSGDHRGGGGANQGGAGPNRGGWQQGQFRGEPRGDGGGRGGNFSSNGPSRGDRGGFFGRPRPVDPNGSLPMPKPEKHKQIKRQMLTPGAAAIKTIPVLANFYRIVVSDIIVQHYDVNIAPVPRGPKAFPSTSSAGGQPAEPEVNEKAELFIKKFATDILEAFKTSHPDFFGKARTIFDGFKNLYSVKQLNIPEQEFTQEVNIQGRRNFFKIKIKHVAEIDMSHATSFYNNQVSDIPPRVLSVAEIIWKELITEAGYVSYQRKYFDMDDSQRSGRDVHDFVRGFLGAVQMTEFGLALNVHLKATATISKSYVKLDQLVSDLAGFRGQGQLEGCQLHHRQVENVNKMIRGLQIFTKHTSTKMSFKVDKLVMDTPKTYTFPKSGKKDENNEVDKISTYDYFLEKYKCKLKDQPMVLLTKKNTYMPLEMCFLQDKQFVSHSKVNAEVQAELLTFSTVSPNVYFNRANKIVKRINDQSSKEMKQEFGVDYFSLNPVYINARQIAPPSMKCAGMNDRLHNPKPPMSYAVVCFDETIYQDVLEKFVREMCNAAKAMGLNLPTPQYCKIERVRTQVDVEKVCKKIINIFLNQKPKLDMLFFGIPKVSHVYLNSTEEIYNTVKSCFDQDYGIISQGIKSSNIMKPPNGYFKNFLLKVNGKYGGQNAVIDAASLGSIKKLNPAATMIVGVDVYHPGPTDTVTSSIAAAIGSYDSQFAQYSASIRVQKKDDKDKDKEMIRLMDEMIGELLTEYQKYNKRYPENLVIFRDGVSEGQLEKLVSIELPLVEKAIKEKIGKMIKLSCIVVQKRHHTRFVLTEANTTGRKPTFNVPKGTVVDTMIVNPTHNEFYLASHDSPLGTTKPTKYIRIRDDLKLSTDDLQKLCYFACHQSIRTRNPISIPIAVKYADLCAYRSSLHIRVKHAQAKSERVTTSDPAEIERGIISKLNHYVKIDDKLKQKLYYS